MLVLVASATLIAVVIGALVLRFVRLGDERLDERAAAELRGSPDASRAFTTAMVADHQPSASAREMLFGKTIGIGLAAPHAERLRIAFRRLG